MKKEEERKLKYETLDEEVRTLEDRYKLFFVELGSALDIIEDEKLFKEGGFEYFYQYVEKNTNFSPKKSTALRGIARLFEQLIDPIYFLYSSNTFRFKNGFGRLLLKRVGWSRAKVLNNKRKKYLGAVRNGVLSLVEVLYFGTCKSKGELLEFFKNYKEEELWIRIYCNVYFPDLLKKDLSKGELYSSAAKNILKQLSWEFNTDFFIKLQNIMEKRRNRGVERDFKYANIKFFKDVRNIEGTLSGIFERMILNRMDPLVRKLLKKEIPHSSGLSVKESLVNLVAYETPLAKEFGSYGIENLAKILSVEKQTVEEWNEKSPLDLIVPIEINTQLKKNFFEIAIGLYIFEPSNSKSLENMESVPTFYLTSIIMGSYLKEFTEAGFSLEEAIEKIKKRLSLMLELNLVHPYVQAAERLAKVLDESSPNGPSLRLDRRLRSVTSYIPGVIHEFRQIVDK